MLERLPRHVFSQHVIANDIERQPEWVTTLYRLAHVSRWCRAAVGSGQDVLGRYRRRLEPYAGMIVDSLCEDSPDVVRCFNVNHARHWWATFQVDYHQMDTRDTFTCYMSLTSYWSQCSEWRRQCRALECCPPPRNRAWQGDVTRLREMVHETLVYVLAGACPTQVCHALLVRDAISRAMVEKRSVHVKYKSSLLKLQPRYWLTGKYDTPSETCQTSYRAPFFVAIHDDDGGLSTYDIDGVDVCV